MKRSRFTEEQIIGILREQEAGLSTAEVCRKHGISTATFYGWKAKLGGMEVSEAKRLKQLQDENAKLKRLLAAGGAADPAAQARRRHADGQRARGRQRPDVCLGHGLSVAGDPQGPAAALDGLRLIRSVELGRRARSHSRRALPALSRGRLARGKPNRRHHRQPERQERGKGGPGIDPAGYDAGKKIKGKKRRVLVDTQGPLMHAIVHAADIQDRDGGALVMASLFGAFPFLLKLLPTPAIRGRNSRAR
jgi:transposase-like protein